MPQNPTNPIHSTCKVLTKNLLQNCRFQSAFVDQNRLQIFLSLGSPLLLTTRKISKMKLKMLLSQRDGSIATATRASHFSVWKGLADAVSRVPNNKSKKKNYFIQHLYSAWKENKKKLCEWNSLCSMCMDMGGQHKCFLFRRFHMFKGSFSGCFCCCHWLLLFFVYFFVISVLWPVLRRYYTI